MTTNERSQFLDWLRQNGSEVLPVTNPYEVARFIARGVTCVIYQGRRGISANGFAGECWNAFLEGKSLHMGSTVKPRGSMAKAKAALLERDGNLCFFCAKIMVEPDVTVEHLVSRSKGQGLDIQDNLALAHEKCNKDAANLPLVKKIEIYCKHRAVEQTGIIS
jgi:HNH endonuclease